MADMHFGLPSNNLRKMRKASELSDLELSTRYGIVERAIPAARAFIEKRITDMRDGIKAAALRKEQELTS